MGEILSQVTPAMSGLVEVVVLDNASPDDTPDVVSRAQSEHPHVDLRYIRRPENIGPDANFCDAPNQALGEFVYLLSDDDVLLPGAVQKLLELIEVHPTLDAFALNTYHFTSSSDDAAVGVFKINADRLLHDRDEALLLLDSHITFLSCIAFRRANVVGKVYNSRYDTNLAQAYMFVDALAPGRGMYATQTPYLARRADNNEGFDYFKVFVTNFAALMRHAQSLGFSAYTVRTIMRRQLRYLCYTIGVFKSRGAIGTIKPNYRDGISRLWRVYGPDPVFLLVIIPLMLMPRALYSLFFDRLYALYNRVRAKHYGGPSQASCKK